MGRDRSSVRGHRRVRDQKGDSGVMGDKVRGHSRGQGSQERRSGSQERSEVTGEVRDHGAGD